LNTLAESQNILVTEFRKIAEIHNSFFSKRISFSTLTLAP
jgi:hypothetical protein